MIAVHAHGLAVVEASIGDIVIVERDGREEYARVSVFKEDGRMGVVFGDGDGKTVCMARKDDRFDLGG